MLKIQHSRVVNKKQVQIFRIENPLTIRQAFDKDKWTVEDPGSEIKGH